MKFPTLLAALAATVPAVLAALSVNTPTNVDECEPTQITWTGGTAPYYLTFVPARQTTAAPIKQFPVLQDSSVTWTCDIARGTSFTIALKDGTGSTAYSDIVTVQAGVSTSCINSNVTESGSSSGTTPTDSSSGTASTSSGSTATGTASSSSASGTPSSSSTHNGAGRFGVSSVFGVAGVIGVVGALLF